MTFLQVLTRLLIGCPHEWKSHAKERYDWTEKERQEGLLVDVEYSGTTEVIVCEHCGKVKIIDY